MNAPPSAASAPAPAAAAGIGVAAAAQAKLDAALQLRKSHKHDESIALLRQAHELDPPAELDAEILQRIGDGLFRKAQDAGDDKLTGVEPEPLYREAAKALEDVVSRYPTAKVAPEALYLAGSSYLMLGELDKSLAAYRAVVERYAGAEAVPRALLRVGVCQAGLDAPQQAMATYRQWLRDYPNEAADGKKVQKYLNEMALVGHKAFPLGTKEWLLDNVGPEGLATFSGEVIVLLFFATWCENCSEEMPHLRRLIRDGAPRGAVFIGVANPEDPKNTLPVDVYVKKNQLDFMDVALDRAMISWTPYRVTGLPAAALIDRKGILRWRGHLAFFPTSLLTKTLTEK